MAGVKQYNVPQTIDGVSIVPTLKGKADSRIADRSLIWNFLTCGMATDGHQS